MRRQRLALSAILVGSIVAVAPEASAQQVAQGFASNRFDPSERGSDWFVMDSLDLRGHVRPALGIVGDWGYKPLVLYGPNKSAERGSIIEHQFFVHPGASLVLWERLRLAFNLPLAVYQAGDSPRTADNSFRFTSPSSASVGDLRIAADVRLLGEHGSAFNSALGVAVHAPTGAREDFTGDGSVRIAPRLAIAGDVDAFTYAMRVSFQYRPDETFGRVSVGSEIGAGASAGLRVADKKLVIGPEIYGSTEFDAFFARTKTPLEWLFGAHYRAGDFRVGAGAGSGLTRGLGAPALRVVANVEWAPAFDSDRDGDRIMDSEDACPTVPGVRTSNPRTNGCPPPAAAPAKADRDGDGITDDVDACPDVPGVASTDATKNGCPPDRDGDGIVDPQDACPDTPGIRSDEPKKNGCPPDRDGDGIPDTVDACPDAAGVKSDDPKRNGCPPDRDNDGILDPDDACPDAPGPADPDPKKNGCPLARIESGQVKIIQQVKFKTNSAEILRESDPVLLAVAAILKEHPEIARVRVEGHTDNRGNAAYNKDLSNKRAASVVKWLTTYGIDKKRLVSQGFGLEKPLDTNETEEGRQNNRRVEFHIEETKQPADAKPGGDAPGQKPGGKPAATKPADAKPAATKPADAKPADTKPADTKPAGKPKPAGQK